jgi:hypothetical protein
VNGFHARRGLYFPETPLPKQKIKAEDNLDYRGRHAEKFLLCNAIYLNFLKNMTWSDNLE